MAGTWKGLRRRAAAVGALVAAGIGVLALVVVAVTNLLVLVLAVLAVAVVASAAVRILVTSGGHRTRWTIVGLVGLVVLLACVVVLGVRHPWLFGLVVVTWAAGVGLGLYAQRGYVRTTSAPPVVGRRRTTASSKRVVFLNPKSGGGKVGQFDLVTEAGRLGVQTIVLQREDDLVELATRAVADGAEVMGMAGGDGSQADVASVCVAHDLPFVCIPAGTRNHFALDLNLDRSDPRPALEAFVEGVELRIDHGLAGERFFVNNVCLGIYPRVVSDPAYRDGRLRAAADLVPKLMTEPGSMDDLQLTGPSGQVYSRPQMVLISNNPYRELVGVSGIGRRVSLTGGELGVMVVAVSDPDELAAAARRLSLGASIERVEGFDQWVESSLHVESDNATMAAGVDGEALDLPAPLDVRVVPGGLRVLVPVTTPAAPPADGRLLSVPALTSLFEIAGGVDSGPFGDDA